MKIRFTSVTTEEVGGSFKGISAEYEARDSDGAGNIAIDSGGLAPSDSYQPTYGSLAAVAGLTQSQIYNDFYDTREIDSEIVGELWKRDLQESLDTQIEIAQVSAGLKTIESVDEITDQEPITI